MNLSSVIKDLRLKVKGETIKQFANGIGVTSGYLSQIERGKIPSKKVVKRISEYVGIDSSMLAMLALELEDVSKEKQTAFVQLSPIIKDLIMSEIEKSFSNK